MVNHYKMKSSIKSFHLGGMACSTGVIGVQLVEDLLKVGRKVPRWAVLAVAGGLSQSPACSGACWRTSNGRIRLFFFGGGGGVTPAQGRAAAATWMAARWWRIAARCCTAEASGHVWCAARVCGRQLHTLMRARAPGH